MRMNYVRLLAAACSACFTFISVMLFIEYMLVMGMSNRTSNQVIFSFLRMV